MDCSKRNTFLQSEGRKGLPKNAEKIGRGIRYHWGIENDPVLSIGYKFRDDESRIRQGNAPENIAIITHTALNFLQQNKTKRHSIKQLRKIAGRHEKRLEAILAQKP